MKPETDPDGPGAPRTRSDDSVQAPADDAQASGWRRVPLRSRRAGGAVRGWWVRSASSATRTGVIVAVLCVLVATALWSGGRWEPSSVPANQRASRVLIVGMPGLRWDELGTGRLPNLDRLLEHGALGAMSVRTLSRQPTAVEAYTTLGAGARLHARGAVENAVEASEGGPVVVPGAEPARRHAGRYVASSPGALGAALHAGGFRTAVVGNADTATAPEGSSRQPAAAALMDTGGHLDAGSVDPAELLVDDPAAPFGKRAETDLVVAATQTAWTRAEVVLVDPGDLDRAAAAGGVGGPGSAAAAREMALDRLDQLLGRLVANAPPATLVLAASVVPPADEWRLAPIVASGPGVVGGYLHSPSTRRLGLVTLTDLAPTILSALNAEVPSSMVGHAFRYHAGSPEPGRLARLDRDTAYRERIYLGVAVGFVAFQAVTYAAVVAATARRAGRRWAVLLRDATLSVAAFPLATLMFRPMAGLAFPMGPAGVALLVGADLAVVAVARRATRSPLAPLSWIYGLTASALLLDVGTGGRLQVGSLLGYSPQTSGRFFGLGNTAFAVLAAATLLGVALHLEHAPRRPEALVAAAAIFTLVVVVDGAPTLGDDVGGILTLVPVFGLTTLALTGRRLSWRLVSGAAAATLGALAAAAGTDLLRPPKQRTHLGQLVAKTWDQGPHQLLTTLAAKADVNTRLLRSTPWPWAVPVVAALLLYLVVRPPAWGSLLPIGSPRRTGVVAALAAGLLGFAVNDSGVVVTAMVLVAVGPLLALLALDGTTPKPGAARTSVNAPTRQPRS